MFIKNIQSREGEKGVNERERKREREEWEREWERIRGIDEQEYVSGGGSERRRTETMKPRQPNTRYRLESVVAKEREITDRKGEKGGRRHLSIDSMYISLKDGNFEGPRLPVTSCRGVLC